MYILTKSLTVGTKTETAGASACLPPPPSDGGVYSWPQTKPETAEQNNVLHVFFLFVFWIFFFLAALQTSPGQ